MRAAPDELPLLEYLAIAEASGEALQPIASHLRDYAEAFNLDADALLGGSFTRLTPISHRPFAAKYAPA